MPKIEPLPEGFDYEMWLGPAPLVPYLGSCFWDFRWRSDYGAGYISDWGMHILDFAQWMIGADGGGPIRVEGKGERMRGGLWDVYWKYDVEYTYAGGLKLTLKGGEEGKGALKVTGTEGWFTFDWNAHSIAAGSADFASVKIIPAQKCPA